MQVTDGRLEVREGGYSAPLRPIGFVDNPVVYSVQCTVCTAAVTYICYVAHSVSPHFAELIFPRHAQFKVYTLYIHI